MLQKDFELSPQNAYCHNCNCYHTLPRQPAILAARDLAKRLSQEISTESLYSEARGKMFGVLTCQSSGGTTHLLKAFSGQYNGQWEIDGWVPPLFGVEDFNALNNPVERKIKALGKMVSQTASDTAYCENILQERKQLSRQLMKEIHALYTLNNFRGEQCSLVDLFPKSRGIPSGTGDCCAPKLLNFAALNNLTPIAIAEFYYGKKNKSGSRHEGQFYLACEEKCDPILGFLLCGIEDLH